MTEAHAEVRAAFKAMHDRRDRDDPRTRRWIDALDAFRCACGKAYVETLLPIAAGDLPPSSADTGDMLDFLEADPVFFRSGYMKEKLLREIKRRELDRSDLMRLQSVILASVQREGRREFPKYSQAAKRVDTPSFRHELEHLAAGGNAAVAARAARVIGLLEQASSSRLFPSTRSGQ